MKYVFVLLLIICLGTDHSVAQNNSSNEKSNERPAFETFQGAIVRGRTDRKELAIVFTGDLYGDGIDEINSTLFKNKIQAGFFLTGNFYRNPEFKSGIQLLIQNGHYLGAHSDKHILYCDWSKRDSLLVSKEEFVKDLNNNYKVMHQFGIDQKAAPYFLPPYEWYNNTISDWTRSLGFQLINFTHGTISHADYTTPDMPNYRSSENIYTSILNYEENNAAGLNGFILLCHIGTAPERTDKFYHYLDGLIREIKSRGYRFVRIDDLLKK